MVDMFPRTLVFGENAKNPLICSRKRKVQKISPRHQSKRLVPCGDGSVDDKSKIVTVVTVWKSARAYVITHVGDKSCIINDWLKKMEAIK